MALLFLSPNRVLLFCCIKSAVLLASHCMSFLAWEEDPATTGIESISYPIEELPFPTITLCPTNPNPDRWGPVIKAFDKMRRRCNHKE